MFSKASMIGGAFLITTIMATVLVQIRTGLGDDTERSVLVRPEANVSSGSRYGEPRSFSDSPRGDEAAPATSVAPGGEASRYGETTPRTASRSSMVDRLKNLNRSTEESESSGSSISSRR